MTIVFTRPCSTWLTSVAALACLLLTAFTPPASLAATNFEQLVTLQLDELLDYPVYAPTKSMVKLSDSPGTVSVITYDQIQKSSARTIPEILRLVPGVNVRWNPMVQTIDIRGFGSNPFTSKVLLLIDGVPYNSWNKGGFPQHPGFDFFNLDNIKHLEVIRGAGSALYGENAFNGVINIVTLSGAEFNQTRAKMLIGERNTKSLALTHGSALGEDSSIFVSARALESQLPFELWMNDTVDDARSYDVFLKYQWADFQASYYRLADRYGGYEHLVNNPLLPPDAVFSSAKNIEQQVNIGALKYSRRSADNRHFVEANLSYANREGSHCAACHAPRQSEHFDDVEDHGNQKFANIQYGFRVGDHQEFLLGAEIRKIASGDHDEELLGSPELGHGEAGHGDMPVLEYRKDAYFIQDRIASRNDRLQLTLGARYENATNPSLFGSEFFPRVALVAKATDKLTLRGGWHQAARYPSFTELYQDSWFLAAETSGSTIPLASFMANPDLQPEHIESYESGIEYQASPRLLTKVDLYQNVIEDSIIITYPVFQFANHPGDARIRGLEAELRYQPKSNLTTFINWSYQRSKAQGSALDAMGNPLEMTYAPRHKVNAGFSYEPTQQWLINLESSCRDEYYAPTFWYGIAFPDAPARRALDGYCLVDIGVKYKPLFASTALTLGLQAKNLANERPYETLSGFAGRRAGREFFLTLEYNWNP